MLFRFAMVSIISASLFCCGCRSVTLSSKEREDIKDFVQKQTGEPVVSMVRQVDADVQVTTDITKEVTRYHTWLLKRGPDGWKLTLFATVTPSTATNWITIHGPACVDTSHNIWVYTWDAKKRLWQADLLKDGKTPVKMSDEDLFLNLQ